MWTKEGKELNLQQYGLTGLALIPEAPSYTSDAETIPGGQGDIPLGKQLNPRNLHARFLAESFNYVDSLVKRDVIYNLLSGFESFYIGESKQNGKRWLVDSVDAWTPDRFNSYTSEITLNLICYKGVAESVNAVSRTYTSNFKFNNEGDLLINPRNQRDTEIIFRGASDKLKIKNKTTNETWEYDKTTSVGDTILLKGVRSTKNSLSIFRDTNKRILTIAPGVNEFFVENSTDYEITIKTPFYFL